MTNRPTHYTTRHDIEPPDTPGREGSAQAVQVLLLLHRHGPAGLSTGDLQVFLGLDKTTVRVVLDGLSARVRVACVGRGQAARWMLIQHAPRADEEAAA